MIFKPVPTDIELTEREAYLIQLEYAWVVWLDACRAHPVFAPRRADVKYRGYATLQEYLDTLNAQNAEITEALGVLRDIRFELYGNEWGMTA